MSHSEQAKKRFVHIPFAALLGVQLVTVEPERAVLRLPVREDNLNNGGVLNGGATASLMNMAGALAAWTGIDLQAEPFLGTVALSIQYLSAAIQEEVSAEARVLRRGRDLFFLEVLVQNTEQKPISKGLMIYRAPQYAGQPIRSYEEAELLPPPYPVHPPQSPSLSGPYIEKLQVRSVHQSPGRVRISMPFFPLVCDEQGYIHEGAIASLMDIVGTWASWTLVQRKGSRGATVGMQISYTAAAQEEVLADARIQRRSEEMFFSTVQVTTTSTQKLVAMGNVSYRLLEAR